MITVLGCRGSKGIWKKILKVIEENPEENKFFIGSAKRLTQLGGDLGLEKVEFISKTGKELNGYFSFIFDKSTGSATNFEIIKFRDTPVLLKDFLEVLKLLIKLIDYKRIETEVQEGSPSMPIFEYLVRKGLFKQVGEKKKNIKLYDNKLYNTLIFEYAREEREE